MLNRMRLLVALFACVLIGANARTPSYLWRQTSCESCPYIAHPTNLDFKDCAKYCTPAYTPVYVPNEEDPAAWAYQKIDHGYPSNSLTQDECQQYANSLGQRMYITAGFNDRGPISASFNLPSGCTSRMFGKRTAVYYNQQKFEKEATFKHGSRTRTADLSGRKKKCGYVYGSTNLQPYLCIDKRTPEDSSSSGWRRLKWWKKFKQKTKRVWNKGKNAWNKGKKVYEKAKPVIQWINAVRDAKASENRYGSARRLMPFEGDYDDKDEPDVITRRLRHRRHTNQDGDDFLGYGVHAAGPTCKFNGLDFSALAGKSYKPTDENGYSYDLTVCGTSQTQCPNDPDGVITGMAIQTKGSGWLRECFVLGVYDDEFFAPNWRPLASDGAALTMANGSPDSCPSGMPRLLEVDFTCGKMESPADTAIVVQNSGCQFIFSFPTCHACTGGCSGGSGSGEATDDSYDDWYGDYNGWR